MNVSFDLKYAWRLLKKSWGYSLICASVVALSVGLALWTWSMAYSQLLKPLGLPNAENWYALQMSSDGVLPPVPGSVDAYTYQELLKQNRSADHIGAFSARIAVLSEGQASTSLRGALVSPRLFAQVSPLKGRTLQPSDAQPEAAPVVILSFDTWKNYFAGDENIVGKTTRIDATPTQIIGVMPRDFFAFEDFEIWRPLQLPNLANPEDSKLRLSPLIALKANQSPDALLNEMKPAVTRVNGDYPDRFHAKRQVVLVPAHRIYTFEATPIVAMLALISAAVLIVGAVNISLVFLARLLERSRELALRTALGASRPRLLRQCLLETILIILLGLAVGYVLVVLGVRWSGAWAEHLNKVLAIGRLGAIMVLRPIDIIAGVLAALGIWLLSTLVPAWRIVKQDPSVSLAGSGKGTNIRASNKRQGLLVGSQVVISSLILVICGSMVLAVNKEVSKPTGINSANTMITTFATIFDPAYDEPTKRLRYWEELAASIQSRIPGADVAFITAPPGRPARVPADVEGGVSTKNLGTPTLPMTVVSDNYFNMLGVRLRSGRLFDGTDTADSLKVAIVDEVVAARYWPKQDPLGKRVQLKDDEGTFLTVVGVVSAVAGGRPYRKDDVGAIYRPLRQVIPSDFRLLVRLPNGTTDYRGQLRAAAFAIDRDLPLRNLQTLDDYLDVLRFDYKSLIPLVVVFALITALITASGLFGLISRSVSQRTQEVGIRRALGATRWKSITMVLRQGTHYLSMAVIGVVLGILVMPLLSRNITNILDYVIPVTLGVVLLMALVIFTASYLPSRRAVALEPGDALRYE